MPKPVKISAIALTFCTLATILAGTVLIILFPQITLDMKLVVLFLGLLYALGLLSVFLSKKAELFPLRKLLLWGLLIFQVLLTINLLFFKSDILLERIDFITYLQHNSNFIPFHSIIEYFKTLHIEWMSTVYSIFYLCGNLLLLAPFGVLIPLLLQRKASFGKLLLLVLGIMLCLEAIQLITQRGIFDIDDILLNTAGFAIGYCIGNHKWIKRWL